MGEAKENDVYEEELLDYEEDDDKTVDGSAAKPTGEVAKKYGISLIPASGSFFCFI
jgi:ATP-dependent RNA helicase UAP56/SUB2